MFRLSSLVCMLMIGLAFAAPLSACDYGQLGFGSYGFSQSYIAAPALGYTQSFVQPSAYTQQFVQPSYGYSQQVVAPVYGGVQRVVVPSYGVSRFRSGFNSGYSRQAIVVNPRQAQVIVKNPGIVGRLFGQRQRVIVRH